MTPEERFRRLQDPDLWSLPERATSKAPVRTAGTRSVGGGPVWVTALVAVCVLLVAVFAIRGAGTPTAGGYGPAGGGVDTGAATASAEPSATDQPSATPSATVTAAPSSTPVADPTLSSTGRPAYEFDLSEPTDAARGARALTCLHAKGVRLVEFTKPDSDGLSSLTFGGADNDKRSITLGLRYADYCDTVGSTQ